MKKEFLIAVILIVALLSGCSRVKDPCECNNEKRQQNFEKNIECENRLDEFLNSLERDNTYKYREFASFYSPLTDSCIFKYNKYESSPKGDPQYIGYDILVDTKTDASYQESVVLFQDEKEIHSCLYYNFPKCSGFDGKVCDVEVEIECLINDKNYCICPMSGDIIEKNNNVCGAYNYSFNDITGSFYSPILNRCLQWEQSEGKPSTQFSPKDISKVIDYKVWSPLGLPLLNVRSYLNYNGSQDRSQYGAFIPIIDIMENGELSAEEYFFKNLEYLKSNPLEIKKMSEYIDYYGYYSHWGYMDHYLDRSD